MTYATTTLTGAFYQLDGTTPAKGAVRVDPSVNVLRDPDSDVILAGRLTVPLVNGALSVPLPSTDDPGLVAANGAFTYTVTVSLNHAHLAPVEGLELPAALASFDLSDLPQPSGVAFLTPVADDPGAYTLTEGA